MIAVIGLAALPGVFGNAAEEAAASGVELELGLGEGSRERLRSELFWSCKVY